MGGDGYAKRYLVSFDRRLTDRLFLSKGPVLYGFASSLSLRETGSVTQSPSIPSKYSLNSVSSFSNFFQSGMLGWLQFSIKTALRSVFYFTSRCEASRVLLGSLIKKLLLPIHALSILALVESLVMSLIGKMTFMSISFIQNLQQSKLF
jgi:hypothetical protein